MGIGTRGTDEFVEMSEGADGETILNPMRRIRRRKKKISSPFRRRRKTYNVKRRKTRRTRKARRSRKKGMSKSFLKNLRRKHGLGEFKKRR